jgi:DNA-binding transcriptional ArsR family regulator
MSDAQLSAHDLALVDATARRVLELLDERETPRGGRSPLVSAAELADVLGVSRDTVYGHADELGAVRLGADGPRPRLRFDVEKAIAAWSVRQAGEESQAPDAPAAAGGAGRSRRRGSGSGVPPQPIGGKNGRGSTRVRTR